MTHSDAGKLKKGTKERPSELKKRTCRENGKKGGLPGRPRKNNSLTEGK